MLNARYVLHNKEKLKITHFFLNTLKKLIY